MNAERLLAHYERIADAPDAVTRLRSFILDLAVRGKLVPHDPKDEPATNLLKTIAAEKARLVKDGTIKKSEVGPVSRNDETFTIPRNWSWTRLGSIGDWGSGSTPPRGNSDSYGGSINWLKSGELNDNRQLAGSEESVTEVAVASGSFRLNQPGDVLIAMYGATIGKVAILAKSAVTNQAVCGCTPFAGVFNQFLFLFLLSQREQFHSASEGGAQPNISKIKIVWTPFPLPPLAEQHRIIAKVDELMTLCDQLETARAKREATRNRLAAASLARLNTPDPETFQADARFVLNALPALTTRPDQIKQLRQTILNLAVRGKLVPQDSSDEPASKLLKRIGNEKARLVTAGAIPRQKEIVRDAARLCDELPATWQPIALGEVCSMVTSGSRGWAEFYADIGAGFIRAQNIRFGKLRLNDLAFVTPPPNSEGSRTQVAKSDLLIVITGAGVTNPALMDRDLGEAYVSQHVGLVRPTNTELSDWLLLCLMAPAGGRTELVERAYGAGKPGLNLDNIRSLSIPLPPLAEQHRIVAKVDELMTLCDQLEASLTTSEVTRRLLDAVLQRTLTPLRPVLATQV